jgi:hypothetical protein
MPTDSFGRIAHVVDRERRSINVELEVRDDVQQGGLQPTGAADGG